MYIDKAIKRQKKSFKIFMALMLLTFITLPLTIMFLAIYNKFLITYLILLEMIILITIVGSCNSMSLQYKCKNGSLKLKASLFGERKVIDCDKVVLVHTENNLDDLYIILVVSCKGRNRLFNHINKVFFKKYPIAAEEYRKIKHLYPEKQYYYTVIKNGGYSKLKLLDIIYRNCVKAVYTDICIENIKLARSEKKVDFSRKR